MQLGSIVLAGGRSARMGRQKESLPWGDGTLLLHIVTTLLECSWPCVVVSRVPEQELPPLHTESELLIDPEPGEGPLAAIAAGMRRLRGPCDAAFVASCDLPFLTTRAVGFLADRLGSHAGVVPIRDDRPQVLCAIWSLAQLPAIEAKLQSGERRAELLAELPDVVTVPEAEWRALDPDHPFAQDVDTPEDYEAARKAAGFA